MPPKGRPRKQATTAKETTTKAATTTKKRVPKPVPADSIAASRTKRTIKATKQFSVEHDLPKKRVFALEEGSGTAFADIPHIAEQITKYTRNDDLLIALHKVLWGVPKRAEIKKHLRKFSGIVYSDDDLEDDEDERRSKYVIKLKKWRKDFLQELCDFLDLPVTGSKDDIIDRIMAFLEHPISNKKKATKRGRDKEEEERPVKRRKTTTTAAKKKTTTTTAKRSPGRPKKTTTTTTTTTTKNAKRSRSTSPARRGRPKKTTTTTTTKKTTSRTKSRSVSPRGRSTKTRTTTNSKGKAKGKATTTTSSTTRRGRSATTTTTTTATTKGKGKAKGKKAAKSKSTVVTRSRSRSRSQTRSQTRSLSRSLSPKVKKKRISAAHKATLRQILKDYNNDLSKVTRRLVMRIMKEKHDIPSKDEEEYKAAFTAFITKEME